VTRHLYTANCRSWRHPRRVRPKFTNADFQFAKRPRVLLALLRGASAGSAHRGLRMVRHRVLRAAGAVHVRQRGTEQRAFTRIPTSTFRSRRTCGSRTMHGWSCGGRSSTCSTAPTSTSQIESPGHRTSAAFSARYLRGRCSSASSCNSELFLRAASARTLGLNGRQRPSLRAFRCVGRFTRTRRDRGERL